MRIDAMSMISQLYQTNSIKPVQKTEKVARKDSLEISDFGRELMLAKEAVAQTSDVREDKVATVKSAMAAGTYEVSMSALADKLLNGNSLF